MITITGVRDNQSGSRAILPSAVVSEATALERMVLRELYFDSEVIQLEPTVIVFRTTVSRVPSVTYYSGTEDDMKCLFRLAALYFVVKHHLHPPETFSPEDRLIFASGRLPTLDEVSVRRDERLQAAHVTLLVALRKILPSDQIRDFTLPQLQHLFSLIHIDGYDANTALLAARLA